MTIEISSQYVKKYQIKENKMKLQICRQIEVKSEIQKIYQVIADLRQWNQWSPWFHMEPTSKTENTGTAGQVGQLQSWEGQAIGSGQMTIIELKENQSIQIQLDFLKPFKSRATVEFIISSKAQNICEVEWKMDSSLPFFMFFFKKMMVAMMSRDFDRGLLMLKEYIETGVVCARSEYLGELQMPALNLIGVKNTCSLSQLSQSMSRDFQNLFQNLNSPELPEKIGALCLTHRFDVVKNECEYTAAMMYPVGVELMPPAEFTRLKFPTHYAITAKHHGAYRHLGNTWGMVMSMFRFLKLKNNKSVPMYEIYLNNPQQTAEKDLLTQVVSPIKK